jgi:hypothetical protein
MSVEDAAQTYYWMIGIALTDACARPDICSACWGDWNAVEGASLALDLANAEASIERLRRSVAWA